MSAEQDTVWRKHEPLTLSSLVKGTTAEIAIVGAGVAGLTAAYVLFRAGFKPIVIEAEGIGAGMTGKSTAHISAAVDGGWRKMLKRLGPSAASELARGYRQGITAIHWLAVKLPDVCDFARVDGELLAGSHDRDVLSEEWEAARSVGLDVEQAQRALSAESLWSIRFPQQGRLHPIKYVDGIARLLLSQGVEIYRARLKGFQETEKGVELRLDNDQIIIASRGAVLAHNLALDVKYPHVAISRRRSYVIAADISGSADTITWDLAHPYHYTRVVYEQGRQL